MKSSWPLVTKAERVLFVASGGGHFEQMLLLSDMVGPERGQAYWATYDSPQTRQALRDQVFDGVVFVHSPSTRSLKNAYLNLRLAARVLRSRNFDLVVSTGAGVAVPFLASAAFRGIEAVYIESITRTREPSLTGKILEWVPGVRRFSQHEFPASRRWEYRFSLLDQFRSMPVESFADGAGAIAPARKVFVSAGSHGLYPFPRLVELVQQALGPTDVVTWQLGSTVSQLRCLDLRGEVHAVLARDRFDAEVASADLVVGHAGSGFLLSALRAGKRPVIVPRYASRHEHVDDHQVDLALAAESRGLADVVWLSEGLAQRS
jgi:UDP-N-acetylglucosamine--N-acetylmuramyl-(pentapeptide) pyrophosphoryl-undecaprenol N-acetylglucosamine transferase